MDSWYRLWSVQSSEAGLISLRQSSPEPQCFFLTFRSNSLLVLRLRLYTHKELRHLNHYCLSPCSLPPLGHRKDTYWWLGSCFFSCRRSPYHSQRGYETGSTSYGVFGALDDCAESTSLSSPAILVPDLFDFGSCTQAKANHWGGEYCTMQGSSQQESIQKLSFTSISSQALGLRFRFIPPKSFDSLQRTTLVPLDLAEILNHDLALCINPIVELHISLALQQS